MAGGNIKEIKLTQCKFALLIVPKLTAMEKYFYKYVPCGVYPDILGG
jgi:hypothetical protein